MFRPLRLASAGRYLVFSVLVAACGSGSSGRSDLKNIFGTDDRIDTPDRAPYRAVGRLDSGCSGTLIGKNLILTAAHCIVSSPSGNVKENLGWFRPNLRNNNTASPKAWITKAWVGSINPDGDRPRDFAVAELDESLGEQFGTIAVHDFAIDRNIPFSTSLVGYSTDRSAGGTAALVPNCSVREVVEGRLLHDCDGASGVSGGPMLNTLAEETYISAITVSEFRQGAPGSVQRDAYSKEYANVAISSETFSNLVSQLLATVGRGQPAPTIAGITFKQNPAQRPGGGGGGGVGRTAADVADQQIFIQNQLYFDRAFEDMEYDLHHFTQWAMTIHDDSLERLVIEAGRRVPSMKTLVREVAYGHSVPGYREIIFARWSGVKEVLEELKLFPQTSGRASLRDRLDRELAPVIVSFGQIEARMFVQTQ